MTALGPDELVERLRAAGLSDDEIVDEFTRVKGALRVHDDGRLTWTLGTSGTLHQQRLLREWLLRTAPPIAAGPTKLAREKIPHALRVAAGITRDTRRPAPVSRVAELIGVDRGTLKSWIDQGWLTLPTS